MLLTYPASHDVPESCRGRICLDGVLTGVRQGHLVASVKESRPAGRVRSVPMQEVRVPARRGE